METYWLSFRIDDDSTYATRYEALMDAVQSLASKWWLEPSSFIVFSSASGISDIASRIKDAINTAKDIVIVGMPDYKSARLIGANQDDDIFELIPFIKKA